MFVNPPLFSYVYYTKKLEEGCVIVEKNCSLESLYDLSLIEIIEAHQNLPFLTESSVWRITTQLIEMIKELHDKNLIYRDLKPDNILISLDKTIGVFNLDRFSLVATDLDTVIDASQASNVWVGTTAYYPRDISKEKQGQHSDIYALGKILEVLFEKNFEDKLYIDEVDSIIIRMKSEDHTQRPTIDDVRAQFLALRPGYLFISDETVDCISLKGCVIA